MAGAAFAAADTGNVGSLTHRDFGALSSTVAGGGVARGHYTYSNGSHTYQDNFTFVGDGDAITIAMHANTTAGTGCFMTSNGNFDSYDPGRTDSPCP